MIQITGAGLKWAGCLLLVGETREFDVITEAMYVDTGKAVYVSTGIQRELEMLPDLGDGDSAPAAPGFYVNNSSFVVKAV